MGHFILSKVVFYSALSFLFGLFLSSYSEIFYLLFLIPVFLIKDKRILVFLILTFLAGTSYYDLFSNREFVLPLYQDQEITVEGRVVEDDRNVVLIKNLEENRINEKAVLWIDGDLNYGEIIRLTGQPIPIEKKYRNYYHKDNITVSFFNPQIETIGKSDDLKSLLFSFRRKVETKIETGLPYPQSAIVKALLLGDKSDIPPDLSDKFSLIGAAHLLAISGTHIVIIAGVLVSFAKILGIKHKAFFSLFFLALFIIFVGAPASALRAGLMGSVFIFSQKVKRQVRSLRSLIYIGLLLLIYNP